LLCSSSISIEIVFEKQKLHSPSVTHFLNETKGNKNFERLQSRQKIKVKKFRKCKKKLCESNEKVETFSKSDDK
jgi:hypothetical protein